MFVSVTSMDKWHSLARTSDPFDSILELQQETGYKYHNKMCPDSSLLTCSNPLQTVGQSCSCWYCQESVHHWRVLQMTLTSLVSAEAISGFLYQYRKYASVPCGWIFIYLHILSNLGLQFQKPHQLDKSVATQRELIHLIKTDYRILSQKFHVCECDLYGQMTQPC